MRSWAVSFPIWNSLLKWVDRGRTAMEGVTDIQGPVEDTDGELSLRIPLKDGGRRLARCSRGTSRIEGDLLIVVIPKAVAERSGTQVGSVVGVDNRKGRLNITLIQP
jgi:hypothetical protein